MMPMSTWPDPFASGLPHHTMPSSLDSEQPRRRRRKHASDEGARESTSSRDKYRSSHKSASSSKLHLRKRKSASRERDDRQRDSPTTSASPSKPSSSPTVVPEMERRRSSEVRPTTSYPSFSKAHSREAVGSREEIQKSPLSPDVTNIGNEASKRRNSSPAKPDAPTRAPPSPPLSAEDPDIQRSSSARGVRDMKENPEHGKTKMESGRRSAGSPRKNGFKAPNSGTNLRKEARFDSSDVSSMPGAFPEEEGKSTPNSSYRRTVSTASQPTSDLTEDTTDSDATSIAPERKPHKRPNTTPPDEKLHTSSSDPRPKSPSKEDAPIPPQPRATPIIDVGIANKTKLQPMNTPMTAKQVPPPPPPPPLTEPKEAPRVDYLLKNGGLPVPVPKRLVQPPTAIQAYNVYQSPALTQAAPLEEYAKIFSTVHKRLDDYIHVLKSNGSLAVATGYKSVARRLLDKLSQVFARDISSQRCDCVVCKTTPQPHLSEDEENGVSWGEILEFVAGRRELPQWPPFTIQPDDSGLGISGATQAPMQKLDIDVPEEYKEHYIRQNQKTKRAVQSWLAQQPEVPSAPPEEADEDTLMFAMMTKLTVQQRNLFIALMHGQNFVSESRAPTPAERPSTSSNALRRAKKALHRLYRLDRPPRDCEAAMYMLHNPHLHGMLATLAEVNEAEWDILISGRFDGFLWSGAEAAGFPPSASQWASLASRGPSRGPNATPFSRNTTPFSGMSAIPSRNGTPFSPDATPSMFPSRGPTPGMNGVGVSAPGPVQLDEDTEIAVAAELERNLFLDMERLEDAFEILHGRAELVRQMLRERSAGLSAQAQLRRGSGATDPVRVRLDTPASGVTDFEEEDDDGLADMASLAPDDSASQISVSRRHRHRRERKTPNPEALPEEDESVFEEHDRARRERAGRRSKY